MSKVFSRLCSLSLSRRTLARVMAAVFFVSLIPLIVIAVYNYPADDDFNFVLPAADAWVRTGSLVEVVKAIWNKGVDTYASWQGDGPVQHYPHHLQHPALFPEQLVYAGTPVPVGGLSDQGRGVRPS